MIMQYIYHKLQGILQSTCNFYNYQPDKVHSFYHAKGIPCTSKIIQYAHKLCEKLISNKT